jgi:hypothetical protein
MQKRGWIQIVEASISMMILFGLVLGLFQQRIEMPDVGAQVYKIQHQILTEAQDDYCVRNEVLANNTESLNKFIASRLCSLPYSFTTVLCSPTESCLFPAGVSKPATDIYGDNLIIAANLTKFNPVKIAFFAWQGSTECQTYECVVPTGPSGGGGGGGCTAQYLCDGSKSRKYQNADCSFNAPEPAPACTKNLGVCAGYTQDCANGQWQDCNYAAIPNYAAAENGPLCSNRLNDDCDSGADEADPDGTCPLMP